MQQQESLHLTDFTAPTMDKVFGNSEVIITLKKWLEAAQGGKINFVCLAGIEPPRAGFMDYAGSIEMMHVVPEVLDVLKEKIKTHLRQMEPPQQDSVLDHSYYCYNIATQSVGYDFAYAFVAAEMDRIRSGAAGPLKFGFWDGGENVTGLNTRYRRDMYENVAQPMIGFLGAITDDKAQQGHRGGFRLIDISRAVRNGEQVPRFTASPKAMMTARSWFLSNEKPITITLRECKHFPHRNSNVEAWLKFAKDLEAQGETVVIVRDTEKATEELPSYTTCPVASTDIDMRLALYECAKMNFFVSNGPSALGWFGTAPFRQFIHLLEQTTYFPETRWWWRDVAGIDQGEQMPWFLPDQKIIWEADTYENIYKCWEA